MLSRSNSDAAIRLRRAKSISSVHRNSHASLTEVLDPKVAQQHAHIAAVTAYEQAQGRRHQMHSAPDTEAARRAQRSSKTSEGSHFLARRDSGRRMATSAVTSRSTAGSDARPSIPERRESRANSTATSRPTLNPLASSREGASRARTSTNSEAGTSASGPPRYVRKAQSSIDFSGNTTAASKEQMLNDYVKSQQNITYDNHEPTLQSITEYDSPIMSHTNERVFSSFVGHPPTYPTPEQNEEPAEKFVRKRTSFVSMPFSGRGRSNTHEPVLTTTTSIVTYDNMNHSTTQVETASNLPTCEFPTVPKNRSMSTTLRDRIKRVFRKTSQPQPAPPLPQQQVTASRAHYGDPWEVTPTYFTPAATATQSSEMDALTRPMSRTPSLRLVHAESAPGRTSREASGSSQKTETQTRSRVTSWSDSTAADTIRTGHNKRLSVIDEYGMPHPVKEINRGEHGNGAAAPVTTSSLGKRIYERLMKRQSETTVVSEHEDPPNPVIDTENATPDGAMLDESLLNPASAASVHVGLPSQQRNTSSLASKAKEVAKSTIRAVTPEGRRVSSRASQRRDVSTPLPPPHQGDKETTHSFDPLPEGFPSPPRFVPAGSAGSTVDMAPSAEQIAKRVARSHDRWKSPLEPPPEHYRNVSARDFASRPAAKYRDAKGKFNLKHEVDALSKPAERPPSRSDMHGTISPSIYSRGTDDSPAKRSETDSVPSLHHNRPPSADPGAGTAVVLPSYRISTTTGSPRRQRAPHKPTHSARRSKDWRAWLSNEVAELETREKFELGGDFVMKLAAQKQDPDREYMRLVDGYDSAHKTSTRKSSAGAIFGSATGPHVSGFSGHRRERAEIVDGEDMHEDVKEVLRFYERNVSGASAVTQNSTSTRRVSGVSTIARKPIMTATRTETPNNLSMEKREEKELGAERPLLTERSSSRMNERFPILDTGRPLSRNNWRRPSSSASQRRDTSTSVPKPQEDQDKENLSTAMETAVGRSTSALGTTSNTLSVPENPLLTGLHRPKSLIPLRARTNSPSPQLRAVGSRKRSYTRMPSPNYAPPATSKSYENAKPTQHLSTIPTVAVNSHAPSKILITPSTSSLRGSIPGSLGRPRSAADRDSLAVLINGDADYSGNGDDLYSGSLNGDRPVSVQSTRRKPVAAARSRPNLFEDATIRRIVEGPYASGNGPSKENSPVTPKSVRMKRSTGSIAAAGGAHGYSPTGGQRMADEWLKRRIGGDVYGAAGGGRPGENDASGAEWRSPTGSPAFI